MNVLFLTVGRFESIEAHSIYSDLLREFRNHGHRVYIVCANERRTNKGTELINEHNSTLLRVKVGNLTKVNLIEKGISLLTIDKMFQKAIDKYLGNIKFDLILYSTPPITLVNTISSLKRKYKANTYLLLKDIFPQNAVDLGMLKKGGVKGILYKLFRKKEKKLYEVSDYIGCMSDANVDYILEHNTNVNAKCIEVCPNSIEVFETCADIQTRNYIRKKYQIPLDKKVFVYGGNLGRPQGITFIVDCLKAMEQKKDIHFVIVGDGTEYSKLKEYIQDCNPKNFTLMKRLPKEDYEQFVSSCDIGLIFLDHRFTIPNFPSRLLSYMQAKIPVLACTDRNTDIGKVITESQFGWWCGSDNIDNFMRVIDNIDYELCEEMGRNGYQFLLDNYKTEKAYQIIMKHFDKS